MKCCFDKTLVRVRASFVRDSLIILITFMIYRIKFKYRDKYDMDTIKNFITLYYNNLSFIFSLLYNFYGI